MRCLSCGVILSDFESTRKDTHGAYLDMCNTCFEDIKQDVMVIEREDLRWVASVDASEEPTEQLFEGD